MKDNTTQQERMCGNKKCFTRREAETKLNSLKHSYYISTAEAGVKRRKIKKETTKNIFLLLLWILAFNFK